MSNIESVKVVLLGESGVGKSSLCLRFVTNEFRPYSEATIGASFMSKSVVIPMENKNSTSTTTEDSVTKINQRNIGFKIWDTAGQEKYRSLAPMYYRGSSAAILVYDITKPGSFAALQDWANELKQNAPPDLVLVVCGNKLDLNEDRLIDRGTGEKYANSIDAMYIETSAKDGDKVESLFLEVARKVPPPLQLGGEYLEEDAGLDLGQPTEQSRSCC
ncbi:hypothetical protein ACHAWU_001048 [Discostella pseudostelligera]|uniref:Uncharacterized protein n=1 Tax=Discostella pseudostelligera TaxID=259834 RepID=A0ABD3MFM2_9STRA